MAPHSTIFEVRTRLRSFRAVARLHHGKLHLVSRDDIISQCFFLSTDLFCLYDVCCLPKRPTAPHQREASLVRPRSVFPTMSPGPESQADDQMCVMSTAPSNKTTGEFMHMLNISSHELFSTVQVLKKQKNNRSVFVNNNGGFLFYFTPLF